MCLSLLFQAGLGREILRVTDFHTTVYLEQASTWYDLKTREPVFDPILLQKLVDGIGSIGLALLDKFFSFMLVKRLQNAENFIRKKVCIANCCTTQGQFMLQVFTLSEMPDLVFDE